MKKLDALYPILSTLAGPSIAGYCLIKPDLRKGGLGRFWPKRIAAEQASTINRVWLHAASAGEVQLANHYVGEFLKSYPDTVFMLTTNTESGFNQADKENFTAVRYFPFDFSPAINKLLAEFKPEIIVTLEMEYWPGLIHMAHRKNIPVAVINARLSESAVKTYEKLGNYLGDTLQYPLFFCRNDMDMENLLAAGTPSDHLGIVGEMKVDMLSSGINAENADKKWKPIMLAVSTHTGEEEIIVDAFIKLKGLYPDLRLIIAPRHIERSEALCTQITSPGMKAALIGDKTQEELSDYPILIEDRFGRMEKWYSQAKIAFVGGSLVDKGAHSVIEPILFGLPVLVGPHYTNWTPWVKFFDEASALSIVKDADDICRIASFVLDDHPDIIMAVHRAQNHVKLQLGATKRNIEAVYKLMIGKDPFA